MVGTNPVFCAMHVRVHINNGLFTSVVIMVNEVRPPGHRERKAGSGEEGDVRERGVEYMYAGQ